MPNRKAIAALTAIALLPFAGEASSAETSPIESRGPLVSLIGGGGNHAAVYGVGAMWRLPWNADVLGRRGFDASVSADVLRWEGRVASGGFLWDVSVAPQLRWRPGDDTWQRAFIELGVGIHLLSHTSLNGTRHFGTPLQFGERFAWGFNFGAGNRYELALFVQHVSNGRIKQPNDGITYYGATLGVPIE